MWAISANPDAKYVAALGQVEFDRRKAVAATKAGELREWKEQMFMAPQFESIALQCSEAQFATLEGLPAEKWSRLVVKLAGV